MIPFIGNHYTSTKAKILVIGESHYLPHNSTIHLDADEWYNSVSAQMLSDVERAWSNTSQIVRSHIDGTERSRAHRLYYNIEAALRETLGHEADTENYLECVSFYNYFQRPAEYGVSIKHQDIDDVFAFNHLNSLHREIQFDSAIFTSKLAHNSWRRANKLKPAQYQTFRTTHPSCSWWNRVHNNTFQGENVKCTGKEAFKKAVSLTLLYS